MTSRYNHNYILTLSRFFIFGGKFYLGLDKLLLYESEMKKNGTAWSIKLVLVVTFFAQISCEPSDGYQINSALRMIGYTSQKQHS